MKEKVFFKTFGCRTNLFDSQVMMSALRDYELTEDEAQADIIVLNSCTVTNSADTTVRSYISQIEKEGRARIYLTGCGAHTKGEGLFASNRVFGVFGQSEKTRINTLLSQKERFFTPGDLSFVDDAIVGEFVGKSRAFIKIQEGCNFRCNYCIIPYVRGDARSLDEAKILEQVHILAQNGFGEFILTGTNVGSYGVGEGRSIAGLMAKMSLIRGVRRIRVGSLEPIQINAAFEEILDEPWLERHLHVAIQHTSPSMLRLMNRRNRFESDAELFARLRERGFALGTDFIVAHPGESEAIWSEALHNFEALGLTHLHAFTYSPREGTPSAAMKSSVAGDVARVRMARLHAVVKANNYAFRQKQGALEVLIESGKEGLYEGYDQFFNKVLLRSGEDIRGEWMRVDHYEVGEEHNHGEF